MVVLLLRFREKCLGSINIVLLRSSDTHDYKALLAPSLLSLYSPAHYAHTSSADVPADLHSDLRH